jgi:DNA-binding NarL/FixJ family response regulator
MAITVLIADDHEVIRRGVEVLLESSHFRVVAIAATVAQLVQLARKHKPDVVLLDVRLGDEDGLDAIRRVRSAAPKTRSVVFSAFDNPTYVARAVAAGANDYLLKTADRDTLLAALDNAVADGPPTRTGMLRSVAASMTKRDAPGDANVPLTPRELQTLRLIAMGLSNREIADTMGISVETVKEHVQNMLRKTSLHDRTQAAVWALRNGFA